MADNSGTQTILGQDLVLMVEIATGEYQQVAHATSHSIEINRDTVEVSSKSTGEWKLSDYGKIAWSGSCDGLVSFTAGIFGYAELVQGMIDRTKFHIVSVLNDATVDTPLDDTIQSYALDDTQFLLGSKYYEGDVIITSVSKTAAEGDIASFSVSFTGASALVPGEISTPV